MGPEPFLDAMVANPDFDVIIGGRAYDPSPYVAFGAFHEMQSKTGSILTLGAAKLGALTHMGKIMECGGLCATPKSQGAIAYVNKDSTFEIKPTDPNAKCTPLSVAAHTLYEKTRPDILHGPGGYLDLTQAAYKQLPDGVSVRIQGSKFHSSQSERSPYTVKLEGARVTGFRTLVMGSIRDPILIPQIHDFLAKIRGSMQQQHTHTDESWEVGWHVYGLNDVAQPPPKEIFVVGEIIAQTQAVATSLASTARVRIAHAPYPGQKATSGNFAMGIGGKLEIETNECTEFSFYHLMPIDEGEEGSSSSEGLTENDAKSLFHWKSFPIGKGLGSDHSPEPTPASTSSKPRSSARPPPNSSKPTPPVSLEPPRTLIDIAKVVRSKNAGPYEITLDVMFDDNAVYQTVKQSGLLSGEIIAKLYNIPVEAIVWCGFFDVALAFKATIPRQRGGKGACSGGFLESDVHGSQQYVPLMELELSPKLIQDYQEL